MTRALTTESLRVIGQISVTAYDIDRAIRFYRDTLGMAFLFQAPRLAFFDCAGVRLMLGVPEPGFDHPSSVLYFKVADIQNTFAGLTAAGVEFLGDPHIVAKMPDYDLWMAFFRDTEGNTLALMCEQPRLQQV